jgi:hypothetical protein
MFAEFTRVYREAGFARSQLREIPPTLQGMTLSHKGA